MILSIVIPIYNVEPFLRECLDSVFSQDLSDCEVICVNDGSTDGSAAIISEYKTNYPNYCKCISQPNMGLSEARNNGVHAAIGDYICFLDSDDYWQSTAISDIKKSIKSFPQVDIIKLDCIQNIEGQRLTVHPKRLPPMTYSEYYEHCFTNHKHPGIVTSVTACTHIIKRAEWENNHLLFDKGLRYEDAMFLYRLVVKKGTIQIVHIEEPFYVVRQNRVGSISTNVRLQHYCDRLFIIEEAFRIFKTNDITSSIWYEPLLSYFQWLIIEANEKEMVEELSKLTSRKLIQKLKIGICSKESRKNWILAMIGVKTSSLYYANTINGFARRLINRFFTMLDTYFPNWLINT